MLADLQQRIDEILLAVNGDEDAFNRLADSERLGVFLRHGHIFPAAIGKSHTARLATARLEVPGSRPQSPKRGHHRF